VQIQEFLRAMTGSGGPTIPHALKSDIVQLMLRFSAVRSRWVAQIVEYGIAEARLRDLHSQMRTLGRVYAHDDNTLDAFLDSAWNQLLTQSAQYTHLPTREAYCTRAFLCMAQAFICGLKSGPAPVNPNALDTLTCEATGGGVGALGMGGASATSSSSGTPQGTVQWPLRCRCPRQLRRTRRYNMRQRMRLPPVSRSRRSTPSRARPQPVTDWQGHS
jgi:hypothetical protein